MGMICYLYDLDDSEIAAVESGDLDTSELLERKGFSLEKSWHGVHFTLSGNNEPDAALGFLLGGTPVGGDMGYGPARHFTPDETRGIAAALAGVSDKEFATRFDVAAMEEEGVYPMIWDEPAADLLDEYGHYFAGMKKFVAETAAKGKGLLIMLS